MTESVKEKCAFCDIVAGKAPVHRELNRVDGR
jgi:hypothetical protein